MFVIRSETVAASAAAYRSAGSLEAAAAVLRAEFRALSADQARTLTARLLGLADPSAWPSHGEGAGLRPFRAPAPGPRPSRKPG